MWYNIGSAQRHAGHQPSVGDKKYWKYADARGVLERVFGQIHILVGDVNNRNRLK